MYETDPNAKLATKRTRNKRNIKNQSPPQARKTCCEPANRGLHFLGKLEPFIAQRRP